MRRSRQFLVGIWMVFGLGLGGLTPTGALAQAIKVQEVVQGLDEPWAMEFLPDGGFLVTERDGKLWLYKTGNSAIRRAVSGLPQVSNSGQGGLLDVMVPRDFERSRRIWLSYAAPVAGGAGTAAGFGTLSQDGRRLEGFRAVFYPVGRSNGRHFGSRLIEGTDGTVYLTTGDRGDAPLAQEVSGPEGKVLAFDAQGNPQTHADFANQAGVFSGLHSLGHRNIQGVAIDAQGRLLTVEHGARGGDEVNLVLGGRNYGWPIITYGVDYNGSTIGDGQAKPGLEQPLKYWDPSIAPSGLMVYSGKLFSGWKGHIFTGSLNSDLISRLDPAQDYRETRIQTPETGRVRDVTEAPDGSIWFLSVIDGAIYRISPGES